MTDLYVSTNGSDNNAGTQASPFRTIERAADAASSGSTVHVAAGTYEGGFQTTTSGVTYVSDVKGAAKIVPGAGNDSTEAWDNRGTNVTIDGFEIDGSAYKGGTPWLFGVYTTGSNSVVQNMKVHDIVHTDSALDAAKSGGQGGAGIMGDGYYGGTNIKVIDNDVYRIGPDSEASSLVHGIYMATNGEVSGNEVFWVIGDGVTSWHDASNLSITGNKIGWVHGAGVMIGSGDTYNSSAPNDYSKVTGNVITHAGKGVEEAGNVGSHNVYSGNTLTANGTDWQLKSGASASAAMELVPEHLTLVQQAAAPAAAETVAVAHAEALPVYDAVAGFEMHTLHDDLASAVH
ncbi:DUF1565 domain-containing protein [Azospirillum sp. TSO22-1]|uniref:DUF1565 domain-containing protein n=1 Tax=Azospirillum sp. TSO22-1 TaxID=716789 RepID=UPI000D648921|nr:DUF1565 domain-containing protein [Azospirillum sp. TSO22-1]